MILDIIKDHYKVKNKSLFAAKMVYIILLLFGGRISFFILISGLFMSSVFNNDLHIDYLVPMTNEEKKLRDIISIFMVNIEYILFIVIGMIVSVQLYGDSEIIKDNLSFILMWTIFMFVCSVENGLGVLVNRSRGVAKRSIKVQVKKDLSGSLMGVIGIVAIGVMSFFISGVFFMNEKFGFVTNKSVLIVFSIIIGMFIVEIFRRCKSITVGDYYEII